MRILLLTQWFQPEPFFKGLPFAKALAERGHDVEVLTGFPNYPGGTVYDGYRVRLFQREIIDGIRINRVALYPSHDRSPLRRMANYLSFAFSCLLLGPFLIRRPDVIYIYNLITLVPAAYLLQVLYGAKIALDIQDLWPESVVNSRMMTNHRLLCVLAKVCNRMYRAADHLFVLSPGFRANLVNRGLPPDRIDVIYNWCDEAALKRVEKDDEVPDRHGLRGSFNVVFAGTMGTVQGLDTILQCAQLCGDDLPSVRFVLAGGGVDKPRLEKMRDAMGLGNVVFLPAQPLDAMAEVFAFADALIVHLKDAQLFNITIPSKTQAYMYVGKPLIMAVRGDAASLVQEAGAGVVCDPENPRAMMNAIRDLYEMSADERRAMGEAGHRFYMDNLSFQHAVDAIEARLASLLEKSQ